MLHLILESKQSSLVNTESDSISDYAPTQIIAKYIKSKGYRGIAYKSSLADGHNPSVFDLGFSSIIDCVTHEAETLSFEFELKDNMYYIDRHGKNT